MREAQSLGAILAGAIPKAAKPSGRRFRHAARFIREQDFCRPIDRNARARILLLAERLERRTKAPGRRNGVLGHIGLAILRALILHFANGRTGLCCPSYTSLGAATGLCVASIAAGLQRLEASGVVQIARRLVRQRVTRVNALTGRSETITTTTQSSNLYRFAEPAPHADAMPVPTSSARPFPARRQLSMLANLWAKATDFTTQRETTKQLSTIKDASSFEDQNR